MIGTGKYDFPGIRRIGALALEGLIAGTSWGASLVTGPFAPVIDICAEYLSEWMANRGLLILDLGAIYVNGEFDQSTFDKAMDEALDRSKIPGLSDAEKKAIDDKVIAAFRQFARVGRSGVRSLQDVGLQSADQAPGQP